MAKGELIDWLIAASWTARAARCGARLGSAARGVIAPGFGAFGGEGPAACTLRQ
jgi:hypothetical protein